MLTVTVSYWEFHNGELEKIEGGLADILSDPETPGFRRGPPKGWTCWSYPSNNKEFEKWMNRTCPTAEIIHRFNSGNPMYTTYISDEKEAMLFQLAWVT